MTECSRIGERQFLFSYVDVVNVGVVYNQTFSDANKHIAIRAELRCNHLLYLPELVRQHSHLSIGLHQCRVVAVGCDIDDALRSNTHKIDDVGTIKYLTCCIIMA